MSYFNLPATLHRKFVNLSLTVQQLVGEIVLTLEGMPTRDNRTETAKLEQAARARRANELITEQLRAFIACKQLGAEDSAIAVSTVAGRTTQQIADFCGLEARYVMRRLCQIKKLAQKWQPVDVPIEEHEGGEVLELFAEAQGKRFAMAKPAEQVFGDRAERPKMMPGRPRGR